MKGTSLSSFSFTASSMNRSVAGEKWKPVISSFFSPQKQSACTLLLKCLAAMRAPNTQRRLRRSIFFIRSFWNASPTLGNGRRNRTCDRRCFCHSKLWRHYLTTVWSEDDRTRTESSVNAHDVEDGVWVVTIKKFEIPEIHLLSLSIVWMNWRQYLESNQAPNTCSTLECWSTTLFLLPTRKKVKQAQDEDEPNQFEMFDQAF